MKKNNKSQRERSKKNALIQGGNEGVILEERARSAEVCDQVSNAEVADFAPNAAVLLDLDGVLCENTFRREFGDDRDYALFGRRCGNAVAIWDFVCFARALKMDNVAIFILTARSESLRGLTLNWLKEKGVPVDELLMRPKGNKQPDYALKKTMLAKLARKYGLGREGGLLPLMAVDDDADTVKMYADANIPSFLPPNVPTVLI